ncbi:hypothetical protein BX600DRAFT_57061 [Xylariales sp. PMI_506]|nr:hypothetical protein BX600DRAFT_57061 [Xylariales sp. PMI_506]
MSPTQDVKSHSDSPSPTSELSAWVSSATLDSIPDEICTRAKYLILDGLACALVAAHLPWSERAAHALFDLEPAGTGDVVVIGWGGRKLTAQSAALLNSAFIQGFELDDWHSDAPLHSNSILLPALFAAAQHVNAGATAQSSPVSGADILLAAIVGYEVGPRVGLALYGAHVLSMGWHSGAVFGPPAAAAAVGRLLSLSAAQIGDAFGTACTQACGLMSAQFGSDAKRMQHGFAARNGLLAAFLARAGYTGIAGVFEQSYGGYLKQFSAGNGKDPQYLPEELTKGLGTKWQTQGVRVKPYASMAGTHSTVDCVRKLQELHPDGMRVEHLVKSVQRIRIKMGEAAFHHGGWKATRPLNSLGAQMNNAYVAATQIVYGEVMPAEFRHDMLENDDLWRLVDVTECEVYADPATPIGQQEVAIEFEDGTSLVQRVEVPRGVVPPLSNNEIVDKWTLLTKDIIDSTRADQIRDNVLGLETCEDISLLLELLASETKNPIA